MDHMTEIQLHQEIARLTAEIGEMSLPTQACKECGNSEQAQFRTVTHHNRDYGDEYDCECLVCGSLDTEEIGQALSDVVTDYDTDCAKLDEQLRQAEGERDVAVEQLAELEDTIDRADEHTAGLVAINEHLRHRIERLHRWLSPRRMKSGQRWKFAKQYYQMQGRNRELEAALPPADRLALLADWIDTEYPNDSDSEAQRDLRRWAQRIDAVLAGEPQVCKWRWLGEYWESTDPCCPIVSWYFDSGGKPDEHGMRYCPGCGRLLVVEETSDGEQ